MGELLQSAPGLTVLVTSREPLGSPGETLFEVRPLPCDGPDSDALALFRARALASTPRAAAAFEDPALCAVAAEVCRRLDGIPLALELAGARLRLWTLEEMAERLGTRLDVLSDPRPELLPRHRTMRTAIGWSHELCEPLERLLWARLSVFTGTSTSPPPAPCAPAARCPPRGWNGYWPAWSPSRWSAAPTNGGGRPLPDARHDPRVRPRLAGRAR